MQLMEYATQDSDPELFEPYRKPITARAVAFREALAAAEPHAARPLGAIRRAGLSATAWLPHEEDELRELVSHAAQRRTFARRSVAIWSWRACSSRRRFCIGSSTPGRGSAAAAGVGLGIGQPA